MTAPLPLIPRRASYLLLLCGVPLVGCNEAPTISKRNDAPVATIDRPADGASVQAGELVTLGGTVTDGDDDAADLVAVWSAGSRELCAEAPVADDGTTTCTVEIHAGDAEIVLEGRDPDNAAGVDAITLAITGTGNPAAQILTPDGTGPYYSDHLVAVTALVSDGEDAPQDLSVAWADESGAALDIDRGAEADGSLAGSVRLDAGDRAIRLTVTDRDGKVDSALVAITVGGPNTPPTCAITLPTEDTGTIQGGTVAFDGLITDIDVDSSRLTATWSSDLDGALSSGPVNADGTAPFTTDTLSAGLHTVTLTGTDEVGATCADTIQIDVSAPPTSTSTSPPTATCTARPPSSPSAPPSATTAPRLRR